MSFYRAAPSPLLCPRCGDVLDAVFDLVRVCMQCEGVWLGPAALEAAFADVKWPHARSVWWRNSMECPECRNSGEHTQLTAMSAGEILVDRCPAGHGLFLDRGELGRLMRSTSDELLGLLERLAAVDGAALAAKRDRWKRAAEERRASHGEALAEQERRRREDRDRQRAVELERERQAAKTVAERAQLVARLRAMREELDRDRRRIDEQIAAVNEHVASHESMLAKFRKQQAELGDDLVAAQRRLDEVDLQLAAAAAAGA